jgi:Semialdehyde dehydrogenase, NAD binding domain
MGYRVAVVGATGNVGREMLGVLAERSFPADEVVALASRRSQGSEVSFGDTTLKARALEHHDFSEVDICLMSAGAAVSKEWSPKIAAAGAVGGALAAPSGSASKMLAALFPEQIKNLLLTGVEDVAGGIPSAERPQRIRDAEARILALEICEERLVCEALDAGLEVHRRIDANPWAILFAEPPEAVRAEAAE